ncbi:phage tail assembly protein [Faunimonas pinastri]|uniref:phage tail assembly protein n=1 Tax=Faunimonas pinastri TaxID=1855383 RepID=UPI0015A6E777|nr:phage tail assembly protein [Faunimonas pinastri]
MKLKRPVEGPNGEIAELVFREPTGADIQRHGNPVNLDLINGDPKISYEAKAMTAMLSALANVPPFVIGRITASDWNTCALAISGFFLPDMRS